jgi:hypothetical protein
MIAENGEDMAITRIQLQAAIVNAKFPATARQMAEDLVWNGLELYREYKSPKYASHTGKLVKKPQAGHRTYIGRYDQTEARTILISALCRAWLQKGAGNPTLNHKNDPMSEFHHFAQEVMGREGIGKIQQHLEKYWSTRAKEWEINEKGRLSGGSE